MTMPPEPQMKRPIGFKFVEYLCMDCAPPEWLDPMVEGDDHGVPYDCDRCGKRLVPQEDPA